MVNAESGVTGDGGDALESAAGDVVGRAAAASGTWIIRNSRSTSASASSQRSSAASAASMTAMSGGSDSKPQTWTSFMPASRAASSNSAWIRRTNGISPVRSA